MAHGIYIGTSGWSYDEWKQGFYANVRRADWLAHYATNFAAVEVNATFYHTQSQATLRHWCDVTPADFRFTIKASRYLTHIQRLNVTASSLRVLRRQADVLGGKLAAVLWQLPKGLQRDARLLENFARRLDRWSTVRHAIEFRHRSWFEDDVAQCLAKHRIAVVQSHAADWPLWNAATTDFVYLRLHGGVKTYGSAYAPVTLRRWSARVCDWAREGREVHVYFDNTARGNAVRNALALKALCRTFRT